MSWTPAVYEVCWYLLIIMIWVNYPKYPNVSANIACVCQPRCHTLVWSGWGISKFNTKNSLIDFIDMQIQKTLINLLLIYTCHLFLYILYCSNVQLSQVLDSKLILEITIIKGKYYLINKNSWIIIYIYLLIYVTIFKRKLLLLESVELIRWSSAPFLS